VAFVASLGLLHPQILSLEAVPFKGGRSNGVQHFQGAAAEDWKAQFMDNLAKHPHDYIQKIIDDLSDVVMVVHPESKERRVDNNPEDYPLLCGDTFALRADVISYCSQIPNPPDKVVNDLHNLHYRFIYDLDHIPATLNPDSLGSEFLPHVVPALVALTKTAPKREHRDSAKQLLIRFGRQLALAGNEGDPATTDAAKPSSIFDLQISTPTVLVVWHEDEAIGINERKQEGMVRKELADFVLSLPPHTKINAMLALGNILGTVSDRTDKWLFEEPQAADGDIKKKLLTAFDRGRSSRTSSEGSFSNAVNAALTASDVRGTTVLLIRLRNSSEVEGELSPHLSELNPTITVHAVLSVRSPTIENIVRGHRGSIILLEGDGVFVFGKVRKQLIDTTAD